MNISKSSLYCIFLLTILCLNIAKIQANNIANCKIFEPEFEVCYECQANYAIKDTTYGPGKLCLEQIEIINGCETYNP